MADFWQQQEQLELQQQVEEALEHAEELGLPKPQVLLLYWQCGIRYQQPKSTQKEFNYAR
jgi:hypothetical protein